MVEIIHFASKKQVGDLLEVFAKPVSVITRPDGQEVLAWEPPLWWEVMFTTARR
jgi:hypothetical protein